MHELAMIMTIALRFIPTLLDETDKIMKAQMSRGADFESIRLAMLIVGTSLLTLTTSPIALTDGIERVLNPF